MRGDARIGSARDGVRRRGEWERWKYLDRSRRDTLAAVQMNAIREQEFFVVVLWQKVWSSFPQLFTYRCKRRVSRVSIQDKGNTNDDCGSNADQI